MACAYEIQTDDELIGKEWLDSYLPNTISDATYEKVDVHDISKTQKHLSLSYQQDLERVLSKYTKLFDSTLGVYTHKRFSIYIKDDAISKHSWSYTVLQLYLDAFKKL